MQVIVFSIGNESFAFDITDVREIVKLQEKTKLPNMPSFMEGIINLRGKITPVINLTKRFNMTFIEDDDSTRLIVINLSEKSQIAIKANQVTEVLTVSEQDIEEVPSVNENGQDSCVTGIIRIQNRLVMLLDCRSLLKSDMLSVS